MKQYILIITLLFLVKPALVFAKEGEIGVVPMFSVTWDKNIGFNFGGGLAIGVWGEGVFHGIYGSLAYSKKGHNLSFGPYAGAGIVTFRVGINRMVIKKDNGNDVFWGMETSPSMIVGHLRAGLMRGDARNEKSLIKLNFAYGLGLF